MRWLRLCCDASRAAGEKSAARKQAPVQAPYKYRSICELRRMNWVPRVVPYVIISVPTKDGDHMHGLMRILPSIEPLC